LVDHKSDVQVGVVERILVGDDHIGRAVVRFGNSPQASEILQDVRSSHGALHGTPQRGGRG